MTKSVADAGLCLELDPAGGVVDAAELQGRGQVDRRLGRAPLGGGDEAGALAGAVEDRAAGRERPGERVLGEHQHADAGAGHAAALGRRRLVADRAWRGRGRPRRRRARSWSDRSAGTRSRFPGRGRAAWRSSCQQRVRPRRTADDRLHARAHVDPRRVVARDPAARADARGVGRRADRGHRGPRARRPHPSRRWPVTTSSRPRRTTTTCCCRVHDAGVRRAPPHRPRRVDAAGPYDELVGQDRVVPYVFPTAAMTQGMPADPRGRHPRRGPGSTATTR